MTKRLTPLAADGLMLLTALIWGSAFVAQRAAAEHIGPFTFTGARFALGALLLAPWVLRKRFDRALLVRGGLTGLIMAGGATLQQWGIGSTTAGNAAFITALYVVIVPFLGIFLGHRVRGVVWFAVALAAAGLWFLSIDESLVIQTGDAIVLACACLWALHVVVVSKWSPSLDPLAYSVLQFAVTGVVALAIAIPLERPSIESIHTALWPLIYATILPVCIAFVLQMIAQRTAPPTHAAIILSLESVFGMFFGALLLQEEVTSRKLLGAGLMLAGMLLAQVGARKRNEPSIVEDVTGPR